MTQDSLAIIISSISILVAALALGWNIYRDIILKAKVKVKFMLGFITNPAMKKPLDRLILSATNFGPGKIRLTGLLLKESSPLKRITRKPKYGILIHDYTDPLSGQLPCDLEVGDGRDFLFKVKEDCFLAETWTHIGIRDSFGRIHWAPKKHVEEARESFKKKCENRNS